MFPLKNHRKRLINPSFESNFRTMFEIYIPLPPQKKNIEKSKAHIFFGGIKHRFFFSRKDVSDGHTTDGFFDGSGRSRHPEGKELKAPRSRRVTSYPHKK